MSWWDALLGRARLPRSQLERLFALSTAGVTLETELGLKPTGRAGIAFRPVESSRFEAVQSELAGLLRVGGRETGTAARRERDRYGFEWVILEDPDLEDLVATVHQTALTLEEQGFGEQLLAVVFGFRDAGGQLVYWVYHYKRGAFYPFVPTGDQQRDNARELRLAAVMGNELPVEPDYGRWFALWGVPV